MSEPANVSWTLPEAAVLGVVVRSPLSVLMGSPLTVPCTDNTRCTLLTFLVVSEDCLTSVAASGSGAPLGFGPDEQPAIRAVASVRKARAAIRRRRVCILCIVEQAADRVRER